MAERTERERPKTDGDKVWDSAALLVQVADDLRLDVRNYALGRAASGLRQLAALAEKIQLRARSD